MPCVVIIVPPPVASFGIVASRQVHNVAAAVVADVAGDDHQLAASVGDPAADGGRVVANRDAGDRQAAVVEDAAAIALGGVAAERPALDRQGAVVML